MVETLVGRGRGREEEEWREGEREGGRGRGRKEEGTEEGGREVAQIPFGYLINLIVHTKSVVILCNSNRGHTHF